ERRVEGCNRPGVRNCGRARGSNHGLRDGDRLLCPQRGQDQWSLNGSHIGSAKIYRPRISLANPQLRGLRMVPGKRIEAGSTDEPDVQRLIQRTDWRLSRVRSLLTTDRSI